MIDSLDNSDETILREEFIRMQNSNQIGTSSITLDELACSSHLLLRSALHACIVSETALQNVMSSYLQLTDESERAIAIEKLVKDISTRVVPQSKVNLVAEMIDLSKLTRKNGAKWDGLTPIYLALETAASLLAPLIPTMSDEIWSSLMRLCCEKDCILIILLNCFRYSAIVETCIIKKVFREPLVLEKVWSLPPWYLATAAETSFLFCQEYLGHLIESELKLLELQMQSKSQTGSEFYQTTKKLENIKSFLDEAWKTLLAEERSEPMRKFCYNIYVQTNGK